MTDAEVTDMIRIVGSRKALSNYYKVWSYSVIIF
jgi:hypothetical protein